MNIDYKLIGERIKKKRKGQGLTQDVLAEKLNVSVGYISQVERGITKISLDLLGAISSILSCDVAELVSGSAVRSTEYMENEMMSELHKLDHTKRKYILEYATKTTNLRYFPLIRFLLIRISFFVFRLLPMCLLIEREQSQAKLFPQHSIHLQQHLQGLL